MSDLRAKIALDGGDDIRRQFEAIRQTGTDAFARTGESVKQASGVLSDLASGIKSIFNQFASGSASVGKSLEPLISAGEAAVATFAKAGAGLGAIAGAAGGVSGAIAHMGQEAANSIAKLNDAASAAGLTLDKYRALKAGFEGIGKSKDDLDKVFSAIDDATRNAELSNAGKHSFRVVANPSGDEDEAVTGAEKLPKVFDDVVIGAGAMRESVDANTVSFGKLAAAADDGSKATGGFVETTKGFYSQIVNGSQQVIRPLGDALKGAGDAAAKQREAFKELGVSIVDLYGKARGNKDVFKDVIDALIVLPDSARRTDLAYRALGRSAGQTALDFADSKEDALAAAAAVEKSGVSFSDAQKAIIQRARESGASLKTVIATWRDYFASLATPIAIDRNNAILGFIETNKTAIKTFADNVVGPAVLWLGKFENALGVSSMALGVIGSALGLIGPAAGIAFGAAGAALVVYWEQIKTGAEAAFGFIRDEGERAGAALMGFFNAHDFSSWDGLKAAAADAYAIIETGARAAEASIEKTIASLGLSDAFANLRVEASSAWSFLVREGRAAFAEISRIAGENDLSSFAGWKAAGQQIFADLVALARAAWAQIEQAFASGDVSALWAAFEARAASAFARLGAFARVGYDALRAEALSLFPALAGPLADVEKFAERVFTAIRGFSGQTWLEIGLGIAAGALLWGGEFSLVAVAAAAAWRGIGESALELSPALSSAFAAIRASAAGVFGDVSVLASDAWAFIKALFTGDSIAQAQAWTILRAAAIKTWSDIETAFSEGYAFIRARIAAAFPGLARPWTALEDAVRQAWASIKAEHEAGWPTIRGVWENVKTIFKAVQTVADGVAWAINKIFGTNITGNQLLILGLFTQLIGLGPAVIETLALIVIGFEALSAGVSIVTRLGEAAVLFGANPWALLVVAGVIALTVALFGLWLHWDQVKAAAVSAWEAMKAAQGEAWDWIKTKASEFFTWLDGKWTGLKTKAGEAWDWIRTKAGDAWGAVEKTASSALQKIADSSLWKSIESGASRVWSSIRSGAETAVEKIGSFFSDVVGKVTGASSAALDKAREIAAAVGNAVSAAKTVKGADALAAGLAAPFQAAAPVVTGILNGLASQVETVISRISAAFRALASLQQAASGGSSGSQPQTSLTPTITAAAGGMIRGAGDGTSDSILARVSNGEYVQPARAAKFFGSDFMDAVRNMDIVGAFTSLAGAFKPFSGAFADGGLIGSGWALPAFAGFSMPSVAQMDSAAGPALGSFLGNALGGGSFAQAPRLIPFALNIGGDTFDGFSGYENAVSALEKRAYDLQMSQISKYEPGSVG